MIKFLKQIGKLKTNFTSGSKKTKTETGERSSIGKAVPHVSKETEVNDAIQTHINGKAGDSVKHNGVTRDEASMHAPATTNAAGYGGVSIHAPAITNTVKKHGEGSIHVPAVTNGEKHDYAFILEKYALTHHPRPVKRSIDVVFDKETGNVVKAGIFFSQPEYMLEAYRKRLDDAIAGRLQPRLICMYCGQMLKLSVRTTKKGKVYFFAHPPGSDACCLKTVKGIAKEKKQEEPGYDETGEFVDGLAIVSKGGKYGVIDKAGTLVAPLEYDEIEKFEAGRAKARRNGRYGYIDESGNTVIAFNYAEIGEFRNGRAKARLAPVIYGKHPNYGEHPYGYIDEQGGIVIPFEYDSIGEFENGRARVTQGMKNGYIDDQGSLVVPLEYGRRNGTIVYFNTSRNFGFITESDTMTALFFHMDNAFTNVQYGDKVSFMVKEGPKGYEALKIWNIAEPHDDKTKAWIRINEAFENGELVEGAITGLKKGGMVVDLESVEAFLPGSQIEPMPIADYNVYLGRTMTFKILKISRRIRNVILSHRVLVENEFEQKKRELLDSLEKGKVVEGTVTNLVSYGAFVHLGYGVNGLIHISDLHWRLISHPSEVVKLGQKINMMVLGFNENKKRISLGLKHLALHPSYGIAGNLKTGDMIQGKIVGFSINGSFVEIMPEGGGFANVPASAFMHASASTSSHESARTSVHEPATSSIYVSAGLSVHASAGESVHGSAGASVPAGGFVHESEISWSKYSRKPQEIFDIGNDVQARVIAVDRDKGRITLSIKQMRPDPWLQVDEKFGIGTRHKAHVRVLTGFGLFVEIEEGICGMIHISDFSWVRWVRPVDEFAPLGSEIDVMVLDIDHENKRLILGHKQLTADPWDRYEKIFTTGSVHKGTVTALIINGAEIEFTSGARGFASLKHLIKEDGTQAALFEMLPFRINELNRESQRIIVAYAGTGTGETMTTGTGNPAETQHNHETAIFADATGCEKNAESNHTLQPAKAKPRKQPVRKSTFGDLEALAVLKARMQAEEDQNR